MPSLLTRFFGHFDKLEPRSAYQNMPAIQVEWPISLEIGRLNSQFAIPNSEFSTYFHELVLDFVRCGLIKLAKAFARWRAPRCFDTASQFRVRVLP